MSAIHDLIAQISEPRLRERLAAEWATASQEKKFGLVFEDHLPELLPLYEAKPRRGDLVCRRHGSLKEVWQVRALHDGVASCIKPQDDTHPAESSPSASAPINFAVDELLVVRQFGEPIFPALVPVDSVANGTADAPWHTLIEADNYHALQLLDYLYAGKVDVSTSTRPHCEWGDAGTLLFPTGKCEVQIAIQQHLTSDLKYQNEFARVTL